MLNGSAHDGAEQASPTNSTSSLEWSAWDWVCKEVENGLSLESVNKISSKQIESVGLGENFLKYERHERVGHKISHRPRADERSLHCLLEAFPYATLFDIAKAITEANGDINSAAIALGAKNSPFNPSEATEKTEDTGRGNSSNSLHILHDLSDDGFKVAVNPRKVVKRSAKKPTAKHLASERRPVPSKTKCEEHSESPPLQLSKTVEATNLLHSMLGEHLAVGKDAISDILGHCNGDVCKALEILLSISADAVEEEYDPLECETDLDNSGDLKILLEAFPSFDPAQIVMTYQEHDSNAEKTAVALLASANQLQPTDDRYQRELAELQNAFPFADCNTLKAVLSSCNNSVSAALKLLTEAGLQPLDRALDHGFSASGSPWAVSEVQHPRPCSSSAVGVPPSGRLSSTNAWRGTRGHPDPLPPNSKHPSRKFPDEEASGLPSCSAETCSLHGCHDTGSSGTPKVKQRAEVRKKYQSFALEHKRKRDFYFREAQAAYERGERARAACMAEKGREFGELFNKAQERAGGRIPRGESEQLNCKMTIDLHKLRVEEALQKVEHHIRLLPSLPSVRCLIIITGHGRHSAGGQGKIKPALINFLYEREIPWTLVNAGCISVQLEDIQKGSKGRAPAKPTLSAYLNYH